MQDATVTAEANPDNAEAWNAARAICRKHARSFYFSSFFLPKPKRYAAYSVYAFCRLLDDATDEAGSTSDSEKQIGHFTQLLDRIYAGEMPEQLELIAFAATVKKYDIPKAYFLEIAQGCRMDLMISRYQTWDDLQKYCYRVAGVVGLIMTKIFGLADPVAEGQAVKMGDAMQLTNILRDVKEDFVRGRIYLPLEDLDRFGYTQRDMSAGVVNEPFQNLMRFEIDRARRLYREGAAGLVHLPDDGSRFTATSMGVIYSGILQAIERQQYDVFTKRARLNFGQKILRLPAARRLSRCAKIPADFF